MLYSCGSGITSTLADRISEATNSVQPLLSSFCSSKMGDFPLKIWLVRESEKSVKMSRVEEGNLIRAFRSILHYCPKSNESQEAFLILKSALRIHIFGHV